MGLGGLVGCSDKALDGKKLLPAAAAGSFDDNCQ